MYKVNILIHTSTWFHCCSCSFTGLKALEDAEKNRQRPIVLHKLPVVGQPSEFVEPEVQVTRIIPSPSNVNLPHARGTRGAPSVMRGDGDGLAFLFRTGLLPASLQHGAQSS